MLMLLEGPLGPWQALLMSPKGRNASRDGFVNLNISFNSIAFFRSLAPSAVSTRFVVLFLAYKTLSILAPSAVSTRFVVLFLVYKTLSIDRNRLELAI